jgi:predicted ferric reductase
MANRNSRLKAKLDRSFKKADHPNDDNNPVKHGSFAFLPCDKARDRMSSRCWRATKRHPANIGIGLRKCGDELNATVKTLGHFTKLLALARVIGTQLSQPKARV